MKKIIFLLVVVTVLSGSISWAQNKNEVLLEINGKPITTSEFKRVYFKNLDLVQEEDQKSIDGYMKLFIDYKLKVEEAYAQGFEQSGTYQKDLAEYEDQLSRNYLFEDRVTADLAKEAFERSKSEVDVSHILIMCGYDSKPKDTLEAYNKMRSIREKALNGADFDSLAVTYSEEPNVETSKGRLGYFTVFNMIYAFETAAYNTPIGDISDIIRTTYGYHILKVHDKRERLPQVGISHIMISAKETDSLNDAKERIDEIYTLLQQGESFESLAKQYSDDKGSGKNGGKLKPFSKGDLRSDRFESAAYNLKDQGEISKPVETKLGWHILRLDSVYPKPTYEEQREFYEKRVAKGSRSKTVTNAVNQLIKDQFGFKKGTGNLSFFNEIIPDEALKNSWQFDVDTLPQNKVLFTLGVRDYTYADFINYLLKRQTRMPRYRSKDKLITGMYDFFEDDMIKEYFREDLEKTNDEYASLVKEYRDGLLIFEVMGKNVWEKARKDTLGQKAYFEAHKQNYRWNDRIDANVFNSPKKEVLNEVIKMLQEGKTAKEIKETLNKNDQVSVILRTGTFEKGDKELPEEYVLSKGISKVFLQNDTYILVQANEFSPSSQKTFEEVGGRIMGDYQNKLEKEWVQSLREKYTVEIHKKALKKLKKELGS